MSQPDQTMGAPLVALLQRRTRWFQEALVTRLDQAGVGPITAAHTLVLAHLSDRDTTLSIAELARLAGVTRQTMHRAVRQLTTEGLVTADDGAGFPRTTLIRITEAGLSRRRIASRILTDLESELAGHLGPDLTAALRDALSRPWPTLTPEKDHEPMGGFR
ncbi:MarR family winged helix-turn-helix transcriptional regulator [Actinoallomurus rhizosphaericola]|uniref:MarR family winged helix-turn-helix transcriptional regulator n=1 Tax=Actinoallomurus rhizosphaericola TaxID=2952536 RepID=UPI002093415A|nr:MarR family transcriptional regulator [Actinoallomurus rhizosphaericola]MCO5998981.1 MarR family transcriptional regulator [Actinoallomurus rhizosphaericola]